MVLQYLAYSQQKLTQAVQKSIFLKIKFSLFIPNVCKPFGICYVLKKQSDAIIVVRCV
jgi:hypothetical protein